MSWPRSFIDEVRRNADAVQMVGEVVALKKRGARWVGLCPFHQEKTPSFTVSDEGLWYCFGCGEGGDLIKFVQQHEGVGFADAVRSVAERAGVPVPASSAVPERDGAAQIPRPRLVAALAAAQEFYRGELAGEAGAKARRYLVARGFEEPVLERFGIGYAPAGWDLTYRALGRAGFEPAVVEAAGLAKRRGDGSGIYDLLRDRIVFPIRDLRRRPVAFGGRVLDDDADPKYLNTPETAVFLKSRTLYGLGEARESVRSSGFAILVEGYLDLLACAQHGFANVVAPLGTAFTSEHARALASHTRKAVIAFDADSAGQSAAERTVGVFLAAGLQVSVVGLPAGQDPDSLLRENGAQGLEAALRRALPALSFLVARAGERSDLRSPQGKAQALAELLGFVLEVDDRVERAEWIGRIAEALQIGEHLVARSFSELKARGRGRRGDGGEDAPRLGRAVAGLDEVPLAERDLLRAVLNQPQWLARLQPIYGEGALRDQRVEALIGALTIWVEQGGEGAPRPESLLDQCDVPHADRMLSRLLLEDALPPDWDYARSCALGIRRDALRRELQAVQRAIEAAVQSGQDDVTDLERRKLSLAQELRAG